MANVSSMRELARVSKEWTESEKNKDLIPVFLEDDCGSGNWSIPSKKSKSFRMGEIHALGELFKEGKIGDLRTVRGLPVKVLIFIPKGIASDEVIKISEDKDKQETENCK